MKPKNNIPHLEDLGKQLEIIFACSPGAHEIRVIGRYYITSLDGKRLERVLIKDSGDPQAYAINLARTPKEAIGLIERHFTDYEAHNCYLAINRVSDNFKLKVKSFQIGDNEYPIALSCTKTKDIQGICALILDLDREEIPTNSEGIKLAASPEELKKIDEARQEIVKDLEKYGLKSNYQVSSGNGYQVVYFFPTQIEVAKTRKTLEIILDGLHEKYTGKVSVDTAMADPVRVARLCGIWNKKPDRALDEKQERIYRVASFLEGRPQLNLYENIQKLAEAMQAWQEKAKQRKKETAKSNLTDSQKKPPTSSKDIDQEWIDQQLQKVALLPVLQRFYEIKVTGETGDKTQLLCPYHDDHAPSAWIGRNSNGVELLHCSSPHCQVHNHPKTALHVVMENGYQFISACLELFNNIPPNYQKTCYKCGEIVFLEGRKRFNLDRTPHKCKKDKTQITESSNVEHFTDLGNAKRLVKAFGSIMKHCHPWGAWFIWDGKRWLLDEAGEIYRLAKKTVQGIYEEAGKTTNDDLRKEIATHAIKSEARQRIDAMVYLTRSEEQIPILSSQMDADPWKLNVLNGTLNLKTGELLPHRKEDMITKLSPLYYDPQAPYPLWEIFLNRIMKANDSLISFLKRAVGYSLTGDVSEQILLFLYGSGANGKSKFLEAIRGIMGQYAIQAAPNLLMLQQYESHPTGLADLFGKRFVSTIETEEGKRMAESLVKQLTGGDRMKARFMRQDFFEFEPTFKIWLAANHKPVIRGQDYAIWRRIKLIPFTVKIPDEEQDKQLGEKLKAEYPGILRWAVEGCLEWQKQGLKPPIEVIAATKAYQEEMDTFGRFLEEETLKISQAKVQANVLYDKYKKWCEDNGENPISSNSFGRKMTELGFEKIRGSIGNFYQGLCLKDLE